MRRAIQQHIEDPLSEELLRGSYPEGSQLELDVVDGDFHFIKGTPKETAAK